MEMTPEKKAYFKAHGYLKIEGVIPEPMVAQAVKKINHQLGNEGMIPGGDYPLTLYNGYYSHKNHPDPFYASLVNETPIFEMAESLMEKGKLRPVGSGQIALPFPKMEDRASVMLSGHIDGMGGKKTKVPEGEFWRNFTAICVVMLSDLPEPYMGNFTVWPGSHRYLESYFQTNGHSQLFQDLPRLREELPHGPVQITGKAGDVVLVHHQMVHAAGPNLSPHIRYAVIFRLNHVDIQKNGTEVLTDIWREFEGVRETALI